MVESRRSAHTELVNASQVPDQRAAISEQHQVLLCGTKATNMGHDKLERFRGHHTHGASAPFSHNLTVNVVDEARRPRDVVHVGRLLGRVH